MEGRGSNAGTPKASYQQLSSPFEVLPEATGPTLAEGGARWPSRPPTWGLRVWSWQEGEPSSEAMAASVPPTREVSFHLLVSVSSPAKWVGYKMALEQRTLWGGSGTRPRHSG